jgi:hypothetical protein
MVTNSLVTKDANDDLDIVWPSDDERARLERILGPYYRATLNAINAILARLLPPDANSMVVSDAAATRILGEAAARVVRIDQATRPWRRGRRLPRHRRLVPGDVARPR